MGYGILIFAWEKFCGSWSEKSILISYGFVKCADVKLVVWDCNDTRKARKGEKNCLTVWFSLSIQVSRKHGFLGKEINKIERETETENETDIWGDKGVSFLRKTFLSGKWFCENLFRIFLLSNERLRNEL